MGLDSTGNNLAVTATAKDHEKIRTAVEQLDQAGAAEDTAVKVYNLKAADPTSVATMLQSLYASERNIRVTADTKNRAVLAVAPAERQVFIGDVIEQLEASAAGRDLTTKVYRFEAGSPYAAYLALYSSLPNARMGYDLQAKTLVVTGTAEDHEAVAAVVKDMDQAGLDDRPEVKVYRLPTADLTSVATALQVQFSAEPRVRVSVDTVGKALIAVAPPDEQKMIAQMIQEIEKGGPGGGADHRGLPLQESQSARGLPGTQHADPHHAAGLRRDGPQSDRDGDGGRPRVGPGCRRQNRGDHPRGRSDTQGLPAENGRSDQRCHRAANALCARRGRERFRGHEESHGCRRGPTGTAVLRADDDSADGDAGSGPAAMDDGRLPLQSRQCRGRLLGPVQLCFPRPRWRTIRRPEISS